MTPKEEQKCCAKCLYALGGPVIWCGDKYCSCHSQTSTEGESKCPLFNGIGYCTKCHGVSQEKPPIQSWEEEIRLLATDAGSGDKEKIISIVHSLLKERDQELLSDFIAKLDWRNRTDGTEFNDGDDVIDWIDSRLEELKRTITNGV